ncbi:MAG: ROK family transcriptional regulator [Spirochaetales bacterium]|nr:ROK family transcriptional regulator [Spirochaetales bacterium]
MTDQTGFSHIDNADRNRRVLLNIVRDRAPLTRREAAVVSGLSMSTTKRLLDSLLQEGVILECMIEQERPEASRRGRKAQALCLEPKFAHAVGINVEPGVMQICAVDLEGTVLHERTLPLADNHPQAVLERIRTELTTSMEALARGEHGRLLGLGIGVAGVINAREGVVLYCPNLPGWENLPLVEQLQAGLGCKVMLDDGVRCLALAEKRYGQGRQLDTFLFLYVGRGVGAGIVLDNRFYRGKNGLSGEFGHITIRHDGPLCNCGNRGCLEALVSREAILRSVRELIGANVYSILREKGEAELGLEHVEAAAEAGDKLANMVVHGLGENIGTGIADLVNIFDPGVVLLGGEVVDHFGDHLIEGIVRTVRLRGIHSITQRTGILTSRLGAGAAARGAATLMIEEFLGSGILNL